MQQCSNAATIAKIDERDDEWNKVLYFTPFFEK